MHRVFCTNIPGSGEFAELEPREKEHLFKILRARTGDVVEILDGRGMVASAVVADGKALKVTEKHRAEEPAEKLHLCCALPKKQKLDQLLKQAAELGAWSIRPVHCVHSVAGGDPKERWDLLLREACKQSGNPFLPKLFPEKKLQEVVEDMKNENIHMYYGSVAPAAKSSSPASEKAVFIGPEGGFSEEEEKLMAGSGAEPLNLGPYILRLETAAICALSALRLLGVMLAACVALMFSCGCSADAEKNPLIVKGKNLLAAGDPSGAREFFRRAIVLYPDDPVPYLALAQVCDEELDAPLEALFAYQLYIQLIPEDSQEYRDIKAIIVNLKERAVEKLAGEIVPAEEFRALEQELSRLKDLNGRIAEKMIEQQVKINTLNRELQQLKQATDTRRQQ